MAEFVMPSLGADMAAGTLVAWRKRPGDAVRRGDIIAEVETDKGLIEVEVFTRGVIEKVLIEPGAQVPVGAVMAIIREEAKSGRIETATGGEDLAVKPRETLPVTTVPTGQTSSPPEVVSPLFPSRLRISPAARKLAAELGVGLISVKGTGPAGRITRQDIERAAQVERIAPATPEIATSRQDKMRQAIATAMARSKREIPHYYLSTTIDMSGALKWLTQENMKRPVEERLLYAVLLIKAVALALREIPELNAFWVEGQAVPSRAVNVGIAISLRQGGLVAPALHDTDQQSLDQLMKNFRDLVKRARAGSLRSSDLSDSTITVTNLGDQGVETVFGIIYPPQVALVGFGKVVERPWSQEGQIVSRPVITASLSADHRVSDGHRGGLFLAAMDRFLQEPSQL
ncbi:MAG: 2-oxo acid dehydrogenase subunit E2 [Acidobacteria bacterium]|nr:2-oxo acid dehydrogenase subunit E2 [Acidobacteriota bacterium]